jgi:tellurite resistance protein TerC
MEAVSLWAWVGFLSFVGLMLALDLGVFHRKAHVVGVREAAIWTVVWILLALAFGVLVWHWRGPTRGLEYFAGFLIEKSLSVDNLFVFMVIFSYFGLPPLLYHRVLVWGIVGAVVLRGIMIAVGVALIAKFHWVLYLFGALLLYTAFKLATQRGDEVHPDRNVLVRLVRSVWPVTSRYSGGRFFVRDRRRGWAVTPLFVVVLAIESTDVVFATDSIPAIFAITRDPFIVFTSNIFAILGLRAIFFLIAGIIHKFRYLRTGLALVLGIIGLKMLAEDFVHVPILVSLGAVGLILAGSVALSLLADARERGVMRRRRARGRGA